MPNHFHLLVYRKESRLSRFMQKLLTSYAKYFNFRHDRVGHLFQNRYRSVACEDHRQLMVLFRYVNTNPLDLEECKDLAALEHDRFTSHAYIIGRYRLAWFDPAIVLSYFGEETARARSAYLELVGGSCEDEDFVRMEEGKLYQPATKSKKEPAGAATCESATSVENILPARQVLDGETAGRESSIERKPVESAEEIMAEACRQNGVTIEQLLGGSKCVHVAYARKRLAYELFRRTTLSQKQIAELLLVNQSAVSKMISRMLAVFD